VCACERASKTESGRESERESARASERESERKRERAHVSVDVRVQGRARKEGAEETKIKGRYRLSQQMCDTHTFDARARAHTHTKPTNLRQAQCVRAAAAITTNSPSLRVFVCESERVSAAVRVERDGHRAQEREGERIMQRGTQSASLAPCVGVSLRILRASVEP